MKLFEPLSQKALFHPPWRGMIERAYETAHPSQLVSVEEFLQRDLLPFVIPNGLIVFEIDTDSLGERYLDVVLLAGDNVGHLVRSIWEDGTTLAKALGIKYFIWQTYEKFGEVLHKRLGAKRIASVWKLELKDLGDEK